MMLENFKTKYLEKVTALINQCKDNSIKLKQEGANDEAILENIKLNVCDIFFRMFNLSYKSASKSNEEERAKGDIIYKNYLGYFDKITTPWREKIIKNKEFNMMEEYHIEEIKIETADKIKNSFIEFYKEFYQEV